MQTMTPTLAAILRVASPATLASLIADIDEHGPDPATVSIRQAAETVLTANVGADEARRMIADPV
jgi:hypothetical protein